MNHPSFSALAMFRLDGTAAMITGAGAGIGRIAALTLAEAGACVAVTDINGQRADQVAEEIGAAGGTARSWALDAGDEKEVVRVVAQIAADFGRLDILINNAGVVRREASESLTMDDWRRVMESSAAMHEGLAAAGLRAVAPYAVSMAYRVRFYMEMNAREAMHLIELRTSPQGHPSYRRVCQLMHRAIREVAGHRAIADAMRFADHSEVELERLQSERALEKKRARL